MFAVVVGEVMDAAAEFGVLHAERNGDKVLVIDSGTTGKDGDQTVALRDKIEKEVRIVEFDTHAEFNVGIEFQFLVNPVTALNTIRRQRHRIWLKVLESDLFTAGEIMSFWHNGTKVVAEKFVRQDVVVDVVGAESQGKVYLPAAEHGDKFLGVGIKNIQFDSFISIEEIAHGVPEDRTEGMGDANIECAYHKILDISHFEDAGISILQAFLCHWEQFLSILGEFYLMGITLKEFAFQLALELFDLLTESALSDVQLTRCFAEIQRVGGFDKIL